MQSCCQRVNLQSPWTTKPMGFQVKQNERKLSYQHGSFMYFRGPTMLPCLVHACMVTQRSVLHCKYQYARTRSIDLSVCDIKSSFVFYHCSGGCPPKGFTLLPRLLATSCHFRNHFANTKQGHAVRQRSLISSAASPCIRSHGMVMLSKHGESYLVNLRLDKLQMLQNASALPEVLRRRKVRYPSKQDWSCSAAHAIESRRLSSYV